MKRVITAVVRLIQAVQRVHTKKWQFFGIFAILFIGNVFVLASLDLLPDASPKSTIGAVAQNAETVDTKTVSLRPIVGPELPVKIDIAKINLYTTISNPETTNIATLDKELLKGAVRYPTSGKLNEAGNVVLFGHSSYLPVVGNLAYKAFNDIQKLKKGDVVTVYSSDTAYTYVVRSVVKESVTDNQGIQLEISGRILTLVTCNSFGTKADRFVVTADFVDSHSISL